MVPAAWPGPGQAGRRSRVAGRRLLPLRSEIELNVVVEDPLLERLQRLPGLDPELVRHEPPCVLEGRERIRLPACAVEGEHQLAASTLT